MKATYSFTEKKIATLKNKIAEHDEKITLLSKAKKELTRELETLELSLLHSVIKDRGLDISSFISSLDAPVAAPAAPPAANAVAPPVKPSTFDPVVQ